MVQSYVTSELHFNLKRFIAQFKLSGKYVSKFNGRKNTVILIHSDLNL